MMKVKGTFESIVMSYVVAVHVVLIVIAGTPLRALNRISRSSYPPTDRATPYLNKLHHTSSSSK
jgi:hypothetical protein